MRFKFDLEVRVKFHIVALKYTVGQYVTWPIWQWHLKLLVNIWQVLTILLQVNQVMLFHKNRIGNRRNFALSVMDHCNLKFTLFHHMKRYSWSATFVVRPSSLLFQESTIKGETAFNVITSFIAFLCELCPFADTWHEREWIGHASDSFGARPKDTQGILSPFFCNCGTYNRKNIIFL